MMMAARLPKVPNKAPRLKLMHEKLGECDYDYYPLGEHIVAARGVCGGRPTVKYRRLDARHIVGRLARGDTKRQVARDYRISLEVVEEAISLASVYDYEKSYI
jgi:uncharacterized protein (DUF433 family)